MQQRRAPRAVPTVPISAQLLVDGYLVAYGDVSDISLIGAGLLTADGFKVGDSLELRLALDGSLVLAFHCAAKVVWSRPAVDSDGRTRCGVRWSDGPAVPLGSLKDLIAASCKDH